MCLKAVFSKIASLEIVLVQEKCSLMLRKLLLFSTHETETHVFQKTVLLQTDITFVVIRI